MTHPKNSNNSVQYVHYCNQQKVQPQWIKWYNHLKKSESQK